MKLEEMTEIALSATKVADMVASSKMMDRTLGTTRIADMVQALGSIDQDYLTGIQDQISALGSIDQDYLSTIKGQIAAFDPTTLLGESVTKFSEYDYLSGFKDQLAAFRSLDNDHPTGIEGILSASGDDVAEVHTHFEPLFPEEFPWAGLCLFVGVSLIVLLWSSPPGREWLEEHSTFVFLILSLATFILAGPSRD